MHYLTKTAYGTALNVGVGQHLVYSVLIVRRQKRRWLPRRIRSNDLVGTRLYRKWNRIDCMGSDREGRCRLNADSTDVGWLYQRRFVTPRWSNHRHRCVGTTLMALAKGRDVHEPAKRTESASCKCRSW